MYNFACDNRGTNPWGHPALKSKPAKRGGEGAHVGAMQDFELRVSGLLDYAARVLPDREVVSHWVGGALT